MSPLKFSSAASRSIEGVFLPAPGDQSFPYVRRRKSSLDFFSNSCGLFLASVKVDGDFGLVPKVVRDHRVHVRQGNGGVLLRNLLGGRTGVERRDKRVERHPRTGDTHDAVGVSVNWNPLNRFGRVHGKPSWFDYTAEEPSDPPDPVRLAGTACHVVLSRPLRVEKSVLAFEGTLQILRPFGVQPDLACQPKLVLGFGGPASALRAMAGILRL